jgi:hypothetical protein
MAAVVAGNILRTAGRMILVAMEVPPVFWNSRSARFRAHAMF